MRLCFWRLLSVLACVGLLYASQTVRADEPVELPNTCTSDGNGGLWEIDSDPTTIDWSTGYPCASWTGGNTNELTYNGCVEFFIQDRETHEPLYQHFFCGLENYAFMGAYPYNSGDGTVSAFQWVRAIDGECFDQWPNYPLYLVGCMQEVDFWWDHDLQEMVASHGNLLSIITIPFSEGNE